MFHLNFIDSLNTLWLFIIKKPSFKIQNYNPFLPVNTFRQLNYIKLP